MTKKDETGTEIADWKQAVTTAAEKTLKNERSDDNFISLKGGVMTYKDNQIEDNQIECVILASSFARTCFQRPYDPDDIAPPECFANAIDQADLVPHENVPTPYAEVCNEKACEWAVFGTALQGKGPRCKTRRKLVLMPISGLANPAEAEVAVIACPPTSGKNWSNYASKVANQAGLPPWAVTTMVSCKPHPQRQFEVLFETTGQIKDEAALAGIHARIHGAEELLLVPYTYDTDAPAEEATGSDKY